MKAAVVRKLANERGLTELERAAEHIAEHGEVPFPIEGEDIGERLTHVLLASRIRRRMEQDGEDLPVAFRAEMAAVRDVLKND